MMTLFSLFHHIRDTTSGNCADNFGIVDKTAKLRLKPAFVGKTASIRPGIAGDDVPVTD